MARRPKAASVLALAQQPLPVRASDPRAQRLAARFLEIRAAVYEFMVDRSRECGQVLAEAAALFDHAAVYNRWTKSLDVSRASAQNFTNVAAFARDTPALYQRWRGLGPAKMYRLVRLSPRGRDKVLATPDLATMNDAAFAALCAPWISKKANVTGNMLGHGMAQKAIGMSGKLATWKLPEMDSPEVKKRLKDGLLKVARLARELAKQI